MKAAVDLHIHSALSPCADKDMTPNNIINMAYLKGLDIIAVTDHNSAENLEPVLKCAGRRGILAIPGMEVETKEEVHLICLFPGLDEALKMQEYVYCSLPRLENREDIFGQQIIMDDDNNPAGFVDRLLLTAADIGIDEVFTRIDKLKGVVVPAHVDRESYSIISNLGIVPDNLDIKFLEVSRLCNTKKLADRYGYLGGYEFIKSSDAHYLGDILERESFIEVQELSAECLIYSLKK